MKLGFAAFLRGYADRSDFRGIWTPHLSVFCSALPNLRDPENPKLTPMVGFPNRIGVECIGNSKIYHNCLFCILVDKQPRKWYGKENIYMEVVDLSTSKYRNRDALDKALRTYLRSVYIFLVVMSIAAK